MLCIWQFDYLVGDSMESNLNTLEAILWRTEGKENKPYKCTTGHLTIGVGRNLDDVGLTDEECLYLLRNDIQRCKNELIQFDWYLQQPENVKVALVRMNFNLGLTKLLGFKKMIKALEEKNYTKAAMEALDSKWADQVGDRAKDIAVQIRETET